MINEFATLFLRVGHSMLPTHFRRVRDDNMPAPGDPIRLGETEFAVTPLLRGPQDLDFNLKGLSVEPQAEVDTHIDDGLRNVVVVNLDLFATDIQRARDHGLADYNSMRAAYGLPVLSTFADVTSDPALQVKLHALYGDVNNMDALVGMLAEDHLPDAAVGPLAAAGLNAQFTRLRDGDRFWYENDADFTSEEIATLQATRLSDIIRRNTSLTELQENVFFVPLAPPLITGDYNNDGVLNIDDLDQLSSEIAAGSSDARFDVDQSGAVNRDDRKYWVTELRHTWIGDANLDGIFDSTDLIDVLAAGTYETDLPATWSTGDFSGDGRTDTADLIAALADGGYEVGARAAVSPVPEPGGTILLSLGMFVLIARRFWSKPCCVGRS
jgi:hypothetical protein